MLHAVAVAVEGGAAVEAVHGGIERAVRLAQTVGDRGDRSRHPLCIHPERRIEPTGSVVATCHLTNAKNTWWQVRDQRYSYTEYVSGREGPLLFDMQQDPFQLHNLAGEPAHAELQQALSAELAARRARIDA